MSLEEARAALTELVAWAQQALESIDGEWGSGHAFSKLLHDDDPDAVLISRSEAALRALISEHENALTTIDADVEYIDRIDAEVTRLRALIEPPTDDEREGLKLVLSAAVAETFGGLGIAPMDVVLEAILASDAWRNRRQGPATEADRVTLGLQAKAAYAAYRDAHPGRTWGDEAASQTGAWEAAAAAVLEAANGVTP